MIRADRNPAKTSLLVPTANALAVLVVSFGVGGFTVALRPELLKAPDGFQFGAVVLAFLISRLLAVRLPQGDEVSVSVLVGLCALAVVGAPWAVLAFAGAGLLELVLRSSRTASATRLDRGLQVLRGAAVLSSSALWQLLLWPDLQHGATSDWLTLAVLAAGLYYAVSDVWSLAVFRALSLGARATTSFLSFGRPLLPIYTVQVAMSAVALRVFPILGARAFLIAFLLTAILQNSFNLYLRIRRAYSETIGALARAAELDRPEDAGHAQRVAELAVAVGRRLRLSSNDLERIGFAALLHDIGKIGQAGNAVGSLHAARGAEIVADIPFLSEVAPLIREHHSEAADIPVLSAVVGVCSEYDRLRRTHSPIAAVELLRAGAQGRRRDVAEALAHVVFEASESGDQRP